MTRRNPWDNPEDAARIVAGMKLARLRSARKKRARPEQVLQQQVAEYLDRTLDHSRVVWSAIGHGGGGKARGAILKSMGLKAGLPDLMLWFRSPHDGRPQCVGIELKAGRGRVSPAQYAMAERLSAAGAICFLCGSLDHVRAVIQAGQIPSRDEFLDNPWLAYPGNGVASRKAA